MKKLFLIGLLMVCVGCFTVRETEFPASRISAAPEGRDVTIKVQGFKATFTEYTPVYGYETVWVNGHYGPHHYHPGHYTTVTTSTYVPQARANESFFKRAETALEDAGFLTKSANPNYVIDVTFSGPYITDGERGDEVLCFLLSLFTAEYTVQTWNAKLKIYDNTTGRMLFHRDYSQRYQVAMWGPLPLISPIGFTKTDVTSAQGWCLTALTDRTIADASAFLSSLPVSMPTASSPTTSSIKN